MSDANRIQLSFIAEDTFGVQKTGSALQILRYTGETLKYDMGTASSQEIRSDRQIAGIRKMSGGMSGDINAELSYGSYDTLLQMMFQSAAWTSPVTMTASTISATAADNSFNDSGSGFGVFSAGQYRWIHVDGSDDRANDGFFKIESVVAGKIIVSGGTLTNESAAKSITITLGGYIQNGTLQTSINIEKYWTDLTNVLSVFLGSTIDKWSLAIPTEGLITMVLSMLGANEVPLTVTGGSSYTDVTTTEPFADLDLQNLYENAANNEITEFTMDMVNQLRKRNRSGTPNAISVGAGTFMPTGTLVKHFTQGDEVLYNKMLNETKSSIAVALQDPAGNAYVLDLPSLKYTAGDRPATGIDADCFLTMNWAAYRDTVENITAQLARFANVAISSPSSSASSSASSSPSSSISSSPSTSPSASS